MVDFSITASGNNDYNNKPTTGESKPSQSESPSIFINRNNNDKIDKEDFSSNQSELLAFAKKNDYLNKSINYAEELNKKFAENITVCRVKTSDGEKYEAPKDVDNLYEQSYINQKAYVDKCLKMGKSYPDLEKELQDLKAKNASEDKINEIQAKLDELKPNYDAMTQTQDNRDIVLNKIIGPPSQKGVEKKFVSGDTLYLAYSTGQQWICQKIGTVAESKVDHFEKNTDTSSTSDDPRNNIFTLDDFEIQ